MASITEPALSPDAVLSFRIKPGTLPQLLQARTEQGPRLKCVEGSVTLVSPGMSHETASERLGDVVAALCRAMGLKYKALASTTWTLPPGSGDYAYEADKSYYIQSFGTERPEQPPDLAVEVVVSHSAAKALRAGALLGIPELWVVDLARREVTFHVLPARTRGKAEPAYRIAKASRAFPIVTPADVRERLDDPENDDGAFLENCREWAKRKVDAKH